MVGGGSGFSAPSFSTVFDVVSLSFLVLEKAHRRTFSQLKHLDIVLFRPQLEDALRLGVEGSNGDDGFKSWELADNTKDSRKSAGLKEEEGDIRMAEAGQIPRC